MVMNRINPTAVVLGALLALASCDSGLLQNPSSAAATEASTPKLRGIWLLGGISGAAISTTVAPVDLYDPVTDTWYPAVTSLPTPVSFAGYAAYDGKLYVIGGFDGTGAPVSTVQIYTIATNTWSTGTPITSARAAATAVVVYDKIFLVGGTTATATSAPALLSVVSSYTPGAGWVTPSTALTNGVSERFSYVVHDTIYNLGGRTAATTVGAYAHDGYLTNPTAGGLTSSTEVAMPTARTGVAGALYTPTNGVPVVILVGGLSAVTTGASFLNGASNGAGTFSNLVSYLPYPFIAPQTWATPTTTTTFPAAVAFGAAVTSKAVSTGRFYHFGGTLALGGSASGSTSVYSVDPPVPPAAWNITAWTTSTMPRARWGHGAVTLNP